MDRRRFLLTSLAGAVAAPRASGAQGGTVYRIGFLVTDAASTHSEVRKMLRLRGYVEGKNLVIEQRAADVETRLSAHAAELVHLKVSVILAEGPAALTAAAAATREIPIVAIDMESDPVEAGLISSLARPGGNVTGVFLDAPELVGKWFDLLRETVPALSRVVALWDASTGRAQMMAANAAARSLAVELHTVEVKGAADLDRAFSAAVQKRPDGLLLLSSPVIAANTRRIAEFALKRRLPAISMFGSFVRSGGLLRYGPDFNDLFARCTQYVIRILTGAKAGELPIQRPTTFALVINLKTAKALGLTIPQSVLLRADQVIE